MAKPKVGDNIWVNGEPQPNGVIIHIDWSYDKEILVQFYDTRDHKTLEWEQLEGCFDDHLNQWIIHNP